jgi:hypothetical protein
VADEHGVGECPEHAEDPLVTGRTQPLADTADGDGAVQRGHEVDPQGPSRREPVGLDQSGVVEFRRIREQSAHVSGC